MSTKVIRPKTHEEWLKLRTQGIGSSEIAVICGLNSFSTPYQLWLRKREEIDTLERGEELIDETNEAMLWGHLFEDSVAQRWSMATNHDVIKASQGDWCILNDRESFLMASPDRTYWIDADGKRNEQNKGIVECKTTMMDVDPELLNPESPSYDPNCKEARLWQSWFAQLQWQLGVGEYKEGYIACCVLSKRKFVTERYDFNPAFFDILVEQAKRFWEVNIVGGEEPAAISGQDAAARFARENPNTTIEVGEDIKEIHDELVEVKQNIKALEEVKAELEGKMQIAHGDNEVVTFQGTTLSTWKSPKVSVSFDYKRYQADHPDECKPYMVEKQGSRRLLIK